MIFILIYELILYNLTLTTVSLKLEILINVFNRKYSALTNKQSQERAYTFSLVFLRPKIVKIGKTDETKETP